MRASDADRDIVLRTLADAYAEGRLDPVEYDERADAVTSAKTLGELPVVLGDLVPMTGGVPYGGSGVLDTRTVDESYRLVVEGLPKKLRPDGWDQD